MEPVTFRLAPQSTGLLILTALVFPLPFFFFWQAVAFQHWLFLVTGLFVLAIWGYIWFWMRPSRFVVSSEGLRVEWPLRSELFPHREIERVEHLDGRTFRERYGYGMRIGAGGLWGGFGLYKTSSVTFRLYVSRMDDYVLIHTRGRPLLITPTSPTSLTQALTTVHQNATGGRVEVRSADV